MFTQKKGPTDEEIKASISKESSKRRFAKELTKTMNHEPGANPFAAEMHLRAKHNMHGGAGNDEEHSHEHVSCDWELVPQEGGPPYYWNKLTGETTYEKPEVMTGLAFKPPPPPPPMRLVGIDKPPPPADTDVTYNTAETAYSGGGEDSSGAWTYVYENEPNPYYWNTVTNETTFDRPAEYVDPNTGDSSSSGEADLVYWQEIVDDNSGELSYVSLTDGSSRADRPLHGVVMIVVTDDEGEEVHWQECVSDNDGSIYYKNPTTGEETAERPDGMSLICCNSTA